MLANRPGTIAGQAETGGSCMGFLSNAKFGGVVVDGSTITYKGERHPIAGTRATVDSAGAIDKRVTATRLLLTGPFAFGLRKKKDTRELYLLVEGPGFAWVVEVNPKLGKQARQFAATVNQAGASTPPPPTTPAIPAGWHPDPGAQHELRYWDGSVWTEHVSDAGVQAVDPLG